MNIHRENRAIGAIALLGGALLSGLCSPIHAKNIAETKTAWEAAFPSANKPEFMKNLGLSVGGWLDAGISTNFNSSPDRFNGPVGLNDRDAEPQIKQLYLYLEREVAKQGDSWDFGGRFDFLYGTDAFIAQSTDHWDRGLITDGTSRFYNIALPQLYAEIYAPVGNGLTIKAGHFYGLTNYESVMAPNNFFYSRTNSFTWDGPFTHTGVLLTYPITANFSITGGGVMGWDNVNKDMGNWNFLGKFGWTSDDKKIATSAAVVTGDKSSNQDNLTRYTLTYQHEFIDHLHYVLQHTYGIQQNDPTRAGKDTKWYGIQNGLVYEIDETLGIGVRGEWNRDQDGVRYRLNDRPGSTPVGIGSSYYEVTTGVNWKPLKWVVVRPEVRYDWADKANAFDNGQRKSQLMFATDVVVRF
ncbi:porin [Methylococcus sp. EFPC2]|uniref:porin n=1 Tax=Methylococcus sp. EFPC2 TaxID=2812648 RepID=UPI001966D96D|nr:porin [Methylococcus sp. EFPC2]QSA99214.1 porin [Methylococcus sp. EFPC2]